MTARTRKRSTRPVTTGSNIRFEEPSSQRGRKSAADLIGPDQFVGGFINFLREHAVVGLAIGFVIGLQAQTLVKQLVDSFISPAFNLFFGESLVHRDFTLHFHNHAGTFGWGAFVYGLLNFLFVLAAIYAIFKYLKLDKLDKPKEK
jgi:large-conductance mechanosensitive channel